MISPIEGELGGEEYDQEEETSEPLMNDEIGGEDIEDSVAGGNNPDTEIQIGKPQVWIRIRPTPSFDNNVFEIGDDGKLLKLIVEPEDRLLKSKTGKSASFKFSTDGILQNVSQEETFKSVVQEVVEKAMGGVPATIVLVGPEISGKFFTLFGPLTKYQFRGVLPRALEKIFDIVEAKKDEMEYRVILSMFEIRKNKIKDLLTLGQYELKRVGDYGPKGLFYEEITSIEQALGLILRGISGQKLLPRETFAKYHTIIYVDIIGRFLNDDNQGGEWRSRITFAKIASMPNRQKIKRYPLAEPDPECGTGGGWCPEGCYQDTKAEKSVPEDDDSDWSGKCCQGISTKGKLSETISIRKDMSFLEQMFVRSHDLRKINEYYQKLESLGMYMLMKPPKLAPSQYFRQSKLAHCLKDIVSGKSEIRIILNVRPERAYLQSTLEAVRFAQRARCVPHDLPKKGNGERFSFEQKIANMCEELGISDQLSGPPELARLNSQISPDKMREVLAQATAYFEEKLDSLEGSCKDQVKSMFEAFREMWTHMLEKDWADGGAAKQPHPPVLEPPPPEPPTEIAEATQTTEDNVVTDEEKETPPQNRRRSSVGKKKLKDREGSGGGKSKGDRKKTRKGRKSSMARNKGTEMQQDVPSPTDSIVEVPEGNKARGSQEPRVSGAGGTLNNLIPEPDEEDELEQPSPLRVQISTPSQTQLLLGEPIAKKTVESGSAPEQTGQTLETPAPTVRRSSMKRKSKKLKNKSIPAVPVLSGPQNEAPGSTGSLFQHEAWDSFSRSSPIVEEFNQKQSLLRQLIVEHNETQKEVSNLVAGLTKLQMDLDIVQQGRYSKGTELDGSGNVVLPTAEQDTLHQIETSKAARDELVNRLKDLREQLPAQNRLVHESKKECEAAFKEFCTDNYGKTVETKNLPLSTLDDALSTTAQEVLGFAPAEDTGDKIVTSGLSPDEREKFISEHFDEIKRIAKRQAQALLQAYPQRPPWAR